MKGQNLGALTPSLGSDHRINDRWASIIVYSMASGVVSFAVGAIASLLVSLSARLVVWAATTFALSVAAGIIHDSQILAICRLWGRRLLHRIV